VTPPPWSDILALHLNRGRDAAVTIGQLQERLGVSRRIVERSIESLRRDGVPICSGPDGIWLTTDAAELRAQYRALRARYIRQAINARALLRTARRFERVQQTTLFEPTWADRTEDRMRGAGHRRADRPSRAGKDQRDHEGG